MTPEELMRSVVDGIIRRDFQPLVKALDEHVIWKSAATTRRTSLPFGGSYVDRDSVMQHFANLNSAYRFEQITPIDITAKGETVWGLFDVQGIYTADTGGRPTRRRLKFEIAIRWRVRKDKVVEHQAFFDTAELIAQQAGERSKDV